MTIRKINVLTGEVTTVQGDAPSFGPTLEQKRAAAKLPRDQFLIAVAAMGVITEAVAEEASTGAWPSAFDTFLSGLTVAQRITAKATWADGGDVRRTNPILALIAADQEVTDAQLDTLFGIS